MVNSIKPESFRHIELGDVSSTNDECFKCARDGEQGGLWITAQRQLGGRGRRGRAWVSEAGNLYASLLLIDQGFSSDIASLPLAVSIALKRTIELALSNSGADIEIKWPNDVLVDGRKISGVLVEAENISQTARAIVIGCGINVSHSPVEGLYPTAYIHQFGSTVSPQQLFAYLYQEMSEILEIWNEGKGISDIRMMWLENAAGIGQDIKVNLPSETMVGQFVGLAENGNLLLKQTDGHVLSIAAGDVFFASKDS